MSVSSDFSFLSFATGNADKFREASGLLPGLKRLEMDLPEPQELETHYITGAKLDAVKSLGHRNVIVEDVAVHLPALNGLPGPLVKWFLKAIGPSGIFELAQRAGDLRAEAVAVIGYLDGKGDSHFVEGRVAGTVIAPRGSHGFGWDIVFVPDGHTRTFAEMSDEEKSVLSHRAKAIEALKKLLTR